MRQILCLSNAAIFLNFFHEIIPNELQKHLSEQPVKLYKVAMQSYCE